MRALTRRELVVGLSTLPLGACASDSAEPGCATPSSHGKPGYCLVEGVVVRVSAAASLGVGQAMLFTVDDDTAVIVARDERGWLARSAICTHSCCVVSLCGEDACTTLTSTPDGCGAAGPRPLGLVLCPCHGSVFQLSDGAARNGPATVALPSLAVALDGDDALVDTGAVVDPITRFG
jgi:Rieske Fe-S protein